MAQLTGAEGLAEALGREGVDTVFGIPGVHNLPIYDALHGRPDIRHVTARHEQGAGFMADGYARVSGRPGVAISITGPGVTNALTPIATAYADSSPVLLVASNDETRYIDSARGRLHELRDQVGMLRHVTAWSRRLVRPEDVPAAVAAAFRTMRVGRPRPVALEIPLDVQSAAGDVEVPDPAVLARPTPDEALLARAAEWLLAAERPVIVAGGGIAAAGAETELALVAERLGAPVLTSVRGKGVLPDDHPLAAGVASGMNLGLAEQADLVLAVGTRLASRWAGGTPPWPRRVIQVDVDPEEIGRNHPASIGLVADARPALARLSALLGSQPRDCWTDLGVVRARVGERLAAAPDVEKLLAGIRAALPRDGIVVGDMTILAYWAGRYFPTYTPRTYLFPFTFGTLGFALPVAIGARAARPDAAVVALVGDGGLLLTLQELATAVQEDLPVAIILVNDGGYSMVRAVQEQRYGGRTIGVALRAPEFLSLARAFGARAERVGPAEVGDALRAALAGRETTILEVPVRLPPP